MNKPDQSLKEQDYEAAKREQAQQPPTREQRRMMDRKNKEVQEVFNKVAEKFLDYFTNHDEPESHEVTQKTKQLDAQWRTYCNRQNLKAVAYPIVKDYCQGVIDDYIKNKNTESVPVAE